MKYTSIDVIQKPIYVRFKCPCCKEIIQQDFLPFLISQGIEWTDLSEDQYYDMTCPRCEEYFRADIELD